MQLALRRLVVKCDAWPDANSYVTYEWSSTNQTLCLVAGPITEYVTAGGSYLCFRSCLLKVTVGDGTLGPPVMYGILHLPLDRSVACWHIMMGMGSLDCNDCDAAL